MHQKRLARPDKYIRGMVNLENKIPGWGNLKGELAKVSARTPHEMRTLKDQQKTPSAVDLLANASEGFGTADAHEYAANMVLPREKKMEFINNAELIASSFVPEA